MHIAPDLRSALADPLRLEAQQAAHAAAFADWRGQGAGAALFDAFAAFAGGAPLHALPALAGLFDGSDTARSLTHGLAGALLPVLRAAPFGQVPLRHHVSRAATTVLLARERAATLTLVALDGAGLAQQPLAATAAFTPAEEWDAVIAGYGTGRLVERCGPELAVHPLSLEPGLALGRDARREALLIDAVEGALVVLRLQRRHGGPEPVREVDLASGAQVHQSAASARESRHEIAACVLGRMGRADAAPVLADLAGDRSCGDGLRWQALREALALDTLVGFRALAAIACNEGDPLASTAGALRARLIEQYPVLAGIDAGAASCPA